MAEQYLSAYAVDARDLDDSLGSDHDPLGRALEAGTSLGGATLPGRGWDVLDRAFDAWNLPILAETWRRPWPFPPFGDADPWPFPMRASRAQLDAISRELADFDSERIHENYDLLPSGDDDADEVAWLLEDRLTSWVTRVLELGTELLIVRDGGR
ncbi:hypothetical protein [Nocardia sp. NPDC051832]|uniref:hypothetical protein n=1 Tax=Nocardia sp. NPDC051832 TaxID=3155673 RepID=UPI00343BAF88